MVTKPFPNRRTAMIVVAENAILTKESTTPEATTERAINLSAIQVDEAKI